MRATPHSTASAAEKPSKELGRTAIALPQQGFRSSESSFRICLSALHRAVSELSPASIGRILLIHRLQRINDKPTVRLVRFTSLHDDGDQNPYEDVAIGEMLVE